MAKIGRTLSYINTSPRPERSNGQTEQNQASGSSRPGNGGSSSIPDNLQDYLLKSIWDRVWEIKTDSQGNEYIFGKLPVVTQYGITMYADGGELNLPSIYAGLPIDNNTLIRDENGVLKINPDIDLGGGASTWDELIGKPTWIGSTKPSYNYSEILQTPDLSVYALTSDLAKYVTLAGDEPITGLKNFTKGLQIDGLGVTKSQDDVIYLDANLVVRGGITMFGTNSVDVPTIMDAIATDGVNLKVVDGVLTFVGSSGGGLTEVYWDDVIGRPTLLSSFIDDVGYLQKSGGQMTGNIGYTLERDTTYTIGLPVSGSASFTDFYSFLQSSKTFIGSILNSSSGAWFDLISLRHTNGHGSDGVKYGMYIITKLTENDNLSWNKQINGTWQGERVILDSVNWSQYVTAANGGSYLPLSGGVLTNGSLSNVLVVKGTGAYSGWKSPIQVLTPDIQTEGHVNIEIGKSSTSRNIAWFGFKYYGDGAYGNLLAMGLHSVDDALIINGHGYVGINTISPKGYLHVEGDFHTQTIHFLKNGDYFDQYGNMYLSSVAANWNIFNNAGTQLFTVNVNGNVLAAGGITMYSDQRKKTILNHVELTLQQIANAPLIEHYYNSDDKRTTHVGSIAQYWTGLNDWFCKLDGDGYYTMEIQNAALASAISIARELVKYESKTDRKIRLLKERVKELEEKIKKLENN